MCCLVSLIRLFGWKCVCVGCLFIWACFTFAAWKLTTPVKKVTPFPSSMISCYSSLREGCVVMNPSAFHDGMLVGPFLCKSSIDTYFGVRSWVQRPEHFQTTLFCSITLCPSSLPFSLFCLSIMSYKPSRGWYMWPICYIELQDLINAFDIDIWSSY